jgi:hypothetical protein
MRYEKEVEKLENLLKCTPELVHASNLLNKIRKDKSKKKQLQKILTNYLKFSSVYEQKTSGKKRIVHLVGELNKYYDFVKKISTYPAQAKLQSSILEEFFFILFKDVVLNLNKKHTKIISSGSADAYTNLYFVPDSRITADGEIEEEFDIGIHKKKQDYAIFRSVPLKSVFVKDIKTENKNGMLNLPMVAIECKTYLDKTMLDGAIAVADKLKSGNPQSLYIVVAEEYDVSEDVDPSYSRIDQIYILRKRKKRKKAAPRPFDSDVVCHLFDRVNEHLKRDRDSIIAKIEKKGFVI